MAAQEDKVVSRPATPQEEGFVCLRQPSPSGFTLFIYRRNIEDEEAGVDANFFDESYTIAGSTGFLVWDGSYMLMDFMASIENEIQGKRVIELGSGTGIAGLYLATLGAHVLLTDLPSVVDDMIAKNIEHNSIASPKLEGQSLAGQPWDESSGSPIGTCGGSAIAQSLDWTVATAQQVTEQVDPREAEIIVAAETVWLKELIQPFVDTLIALLSGPRRPRCYLSYHNRGQEKSECFATTSELLKCIEQSGCRVSIRREGQAPSTKLTCTLYEVELI